MKQLLLESFCMCYDTYFGVLANGDTQVGKHGANLSCMLKPQTCNQKSNASINIVDPQYNAASIMKRIRITEKLLRLWSLVCFTALCCEGRSLYAQHPMTLSDLINRMEGKTLNLERVEVSKEEIALLAKIPTLEGLILGGPQITDSTLEQIEELAGLKTLSISDAAITASGIQKLASLPNLWGLRLSGKGITDACLVNIGEIETLKQISLDQTAVTNDGLSHLKNLYGLQRLDLTGSSAIIKDASIPWAATQGKVHTYQPMILEVTIDSRSYHYTHMQNILRLQAEGLTVLQEIPGIAIEFDKEHVSNVLKITEVNLSETQLAAILKLKGMQQIKLTNTNMNAISLSKLRRLPYLRDLSYVLQGNKVTNSSLQSLQGIRVPSLSLLDTQITDNGLLLLKNSTFNRLSISSSLITSAGLRHLNLAPVTELALSLELLTNDGLGDLKRAINLESISLNHRQVTDTGLKQITELSSLRNVSLADTQIGNGGIALIAAMPKLINLDLSRTQITDAGLPWLASLKELSYLRLSGTQITDAGVVAISKMPSIKMLDLSNTAVTDAGLASLQELDLVSLDLSGSRITDKGLVYLKKFVWWGVTPNLKLNNTSVTEAGIKALATNWVEENDLAFDDRVLSIVPLGTHRIRKSNWGMEYLACSPDSKYLAIGQMSPNIQGPDGRYRNTQSGRIELWNLQTQVMTILEDEIKTHINPTQFPVAFSPDGLLLASASNGGRVKIWDLNQDPISNPKEIRFGRNLNASIATALCFSPDSRQLVIGTPRLRAFEVSTANEIEFLTNKEVEVFFGKSVLDFSKDLNYVGVGSDSGIELFDTDGGKTSTLLKLALIGGVKFLKFLPDNKHAIVVDGSNGLGSSRVHVCNLRTKVLVSTIPLMSGENPWLSISADGTKLVLANVVVEKSAAYLAWRKLNGFDDFNFQAPYRVSLWRITDGIPVFIGQINTGMEHVTAIAMTPDGKTLITVGQSLRLWDISQVK